MPERLIGRLAVDYVVKWARITTLAVSSDLRTAMVFATVFQASTDHLEPTRAADARPRPISIYALAQALGQPRESVRRKVSALRARGLLLDDPAGVLLNPRVLRDLDSEPMVMEMRRLTAEFRLTLGALGYPPRGGDRATGIRNDWIARAINSFCLRLLDDMARNYGGHVLLTLAFCAISTANTRHLGAAEGAPYAEFDPPIPDGLRQPLTALALAEELALPRETARRYVSRLIESGACRAVRGGVIAVEQAVNVPETHAFFARTRSNVGRFARALDDAGLSSLTA